MTENRFIAQLEFAADNAETMPPEELAILLRRAALRLRSIDRGLQLVKGGIAEAIEEIDRAGPLKPED